MIENINFIFNYNFIRELMPKGTVKWFNQSKGYGFIERDSGKDLFVHKSDIQGESLREGEEVEFEITTDQKGDRATRVKSVYS